MFKYGPDDTCFNEMFRFTTLEDYGCMKQYMYLSWSQHNTAFAEEYGDWAQALCTAQELSDWEERYSDGRRRLFSEEAPPADAKIDELEAKMMTAA